MGKNQIKRIKKEEKGSVTLFVLVTCMFFITIVLLAYINIMDKQINQEKQIGQIVKNYQVSDEELQKAYDSFQQEKGIYVALKGNTLYFYNDENQAKENADKYYEDIKDKVFTRSWSTGPNTPWYEDREKIQTVNIATPITPISMACYFSDLKSLTTIDNIKNINTKNVTNMYALFYNCTNLTQIDVSNFKTSKVTSMDAMFYNCENLTRNKWTRPA